jgi:hypothetical protein
MVLEAGMSKSMAPIADPHFMSMWGAPSCCILHSMVEDVMMRQNKHVHLGLSFSSPWSHWCHHGDPIPKTPSIPNYFPKPHLQILLMNFGTRFPIYKFIFRGHIQAGHNNGTIQQNNTQKSSSLSSFLCQGLLIFFTSWIHLVTW